MLNCEIIRVRAQEQHYFGASFRLLWFVHHLISRVCLWLLLLTVFLFPESCRTVRGFYQVYCKTGVNQE